MIPDLRYKLTRVLSKPIRTEALVVYVMVETRKLIDRLDASRDYPVLKLFSDWTVHTNIDRNRAAEPLMWEFDKAAESVKCGNGIPLAFLEFLSLSHFRDEFGRFLKSNDLPCLLVENMDVWNAFLNRYSGVVSDCPITYTNRQMPFKLISTVTLTKDTPTEESYAYVKSLLGREPQALWMNWRIELTDGTVENWPFYN